ncbi:MAG TPA: hypothetical protein VFR15_17925 [Chloroflexia bacterium]|nr:hypothetical protein [Chloroflexia bacterium]
MKPKSFVLVVTLLALLFASSLAARPVYAYACGDIPTEEEAWANADVVFTGKVTRVTRAWVGENKYRNHTYELEVQSVSKGRVGPSATFRYWHSDSYGFEQGGTYLVYAYYAGPNPGDLETSICTGTRLISGPGPDPIAALLGAAAGTLVLGLGGHMYTRRRRMRADVLD